jgi:Mg-chelatase subunit ChlD
MKFRRFIKESLRSAPAWLLSGLLHAGLLALAGMVTWVVLQPKILDRLLMLAPPVAGVSESGRDDAGGSGGGGGGRASAARGGPEAAGAHAAETVVAAAAPAPLKLMEALSAPTAGTGSDQAMFGVRDASGLLTAAALGGMKGTGGGGGGTPGGGFGPGILEGTSPGFGRHIGELRGVGLDLVLVLDATDSMTPFIEQAKVRLQSVLSVVTGLVPNARVGIVAYKDYGDDYGPDATKSIPLTTDHQAIRKFLDEITAGGGGDIPEPIHEAIGAATSAKRMGWNPRRKHVNILVGDSPNHASGRKTLYTLAAAFTHDGGVINVIDTGGTGAPSVVRTALQPDLQRLAKDGGGEAFLLKDVDAFWRHLITSVFGQRYEQDINVIIEKFTKKE